MSIEDLILTANDNRIKYKEAKRVEKEAGIAYYTAQDELVKELQKEVNEKLGGVYTARITLYPGK